MDLFISAPYHLIFPSPHINPLSFNIQEAFSHITKNREESIFSDVPDRFEGFLGGSAVTLTEEHQNILIKIVLLLDCKEKGFIPLYTRGGTLIAASVHFGGYHGRYMAQLMRYELGGSHSRPLLLEKDSPNDGVVRFFRQRLNEHMSRFPDESLPISCEEDQLSRVAETFQSEAFWDTGKSEWTSNDLPKNIFPLRYQYVPILPPTLFLLALDENKKLMLAHQHEIRQRHAAISNNQIVNWARGEGLSDSLCYLMERIVANNPDCVYQVGLTGSQT